MHVAADSGLPQCRYYFVILFQHLRHSGALAIFEHCIGVGVAYAGVGAAVFCCCCTFCLLFGNLCNGTVQFVIYFVLIFANFFYFLCVYECWALKKWNEMRIETYWKIDVGKNRLLAAMFRSSTCCINCVHLKAVGVKVLANGFISRKWKWREWRWFFNNGTVNIINKSYIEGINNYL